MILSEPFFSQEEMLALNKGQLLSILEFLSITCDSKKDTKATLIGKLQDYQTSIQQPADISPAPPRYSVRVRAIMERLEKEKNG